MSSDTGKQKVADIVKRFVLATSDYGTRTAGRLGHVSHTTVAVWRDWQSKGSDPKTLPPPLPETVQSLRDYLGRAGDIEIRRAAFHIAADRLDELAKQLRLEATTSLGADAPLLKLETGLQSDAGIGKKTKTREGPPRS